MAAGSAQESESEGFNAERPADDSSVTPLSGFRFIPFRRSDLLQMLRSEARLGALQERAFEDSVLTIGETFRNDFHDSRQALKDCYAVLDPDADTRQFPDGASSQDAAVEELKDRLAVLLNRGNYEALTEAQLKKAFRSKSLFQIRLRVDLKDFDDLMLFCRGSSERTETVTLFFGLIKRQVRFLNYDRVVLFLRFADRGVKTDKDFSPGRVMIKLFQNVPDADLEMLFPNTRVAMRWTDRLLIGVPALASGAIVATTKLAAPLVLLGTLGGFWLGLHSEPVTLDKRGLVVLGAGMAALGAYLWKQWSSYRNRKERFRQTLTRDLYFKLLDNNAGVLLRVLDDAEDSECKEAFVALYFLLAEARPLSAQKLDELIEDWFAKRWHARLDFEIEDALQKLEHIGLAQKHDGLWSVPSTAATSAAVPS
ncbi:TMEM143 family protein [Congregibacter variabilis]|uniref:TMEM143 family protein n=1 Tax=Congregibacter variabilis TaxID=3081200 RepID=A0ABZ0I7T2_9GAMM|nr:TMEM143 family protein [Congregibacter sp. IMCC43200]